MSIECGGNVITHCTACSGNVCGTCENGLAGDSCDQCATTAFKINMVDTVCVGCQYSGCAECSTEGVCNQCKDGIEGQSCNVCKDKTKYFFWGNCIDCSQSPCGENGECDGTYDCTCKNNEDCCIKSRGGVYYESGGKHTCSNCILPGCGTCGGEGITCTGCMDGTTPNGAIESKCASVLDKYLSEMDNANSIFGICGIILALFLLL